MKLVIVGGVAGGASAAARARRVSENAEIVVFERGPDVSFANCGLPYYIGGEIAERDKLLVVTPERLKERYKLDVRVRSSVESIDRANKCVRVRDLATGREYEEPYDKLNLAPGAAPFRPPVPGVDLPGIFTLRTLQDTDRIKARLDSGVNQAVVIGGGFVGLELVENFVRRGIAGDPLLIDADLLLESLKIGGGFQSSCLENPPRTLQPPVEDRRLFSSPEPPRSEPGMGKRCPVCENGDTEGWQSG